MNNQPAQKHDFDAPLVNAAKALLNKSLLHNSTLLSWQVAYLKSASKCEKLSDTQVRIIHGIKCENA